MNLLWLQSGGCGGCTLSWLGSEHGSLFRELAAEGIELLWHPSLSESGVDEARDLIARCADGRTRVDVLCIEGSLLRGPLGSGGFHRFGGGAQPMIDWVRQIAARARHVVAIGSCSAWGGITAAGVNPTDACGLQYDGEAAGGLLGPGFRDAAGLPVINVAGCPPHPDWITETLAMLAHGRLGAAQLDDLGRPRFYADQLVHHGCPRNEYYEFKASASQAFGAGLSDGTAWVARGPKPMPIATSACGMANGSCLRGGFACIRCTESRFRGARTSPLRPRRRWPGSRSGLPADMPKAWFMALAALSKSATPAACTRKRHSRSSGAQARRAHG
jgi:NiFe hydrogenase small subunit HydA